MLNQQQDDWLNPTRELLTQWGEHLRSIQGIGLGYPSRACHLSEHGSPRPIPEDSVAERVERVLCKVRSISPNSYAVLNLIYHLDLSEREVSERIHKSRAKCREMKISGEVMVATLWMSERTRQEG